MSWPELERLVTDAEASESLRRSLRRCRSREELLLAARRLGYRVTRIDLQNAWIAHRQAAAEEHFEEQHSVGAGI
ncbi:Nif11 family protein [Cyanobium sp. Cruz CV13-4-11]|uniref:Nif11 family protein n=1 Tax=unclassified Cyanobium TaxID=2627006 RepID=UPI0020CBA4EC|nr:MULTISPECIES: Nif11 family protein [unclassified Cyanobium]MCP9901964.1 Nif11 family protein [Cyanobium sp. Cruz CV11-17]MCP9920854.1 Nif11 family protein [Cyanobium sp. Cruz CV13-4-11]